MSPAAKSRSKAARSSKEQAKVSPKVSSSPAGGNGVPASAYNPLSGTFHTLEITPLTSAPTPLNNGRFRSIDENEDHSGSSFGTSAEYDSMSNNGSCSGESEDQKEKPTPTPAPQTEPVPGAATDKREKIRQKNEKKHQRQKERRAQELHERCCGYIMSRKLEALSQQLVAMGFASEQATMALMLNEGHVEESVSWLLEGSEDSKQVATNLDRVNLKIDITDELARIASMEMLFKCTKQEVERAVVACEGDLEKAATTLTSQKQESAAKLEGPPGEAMLANGNGKPVASAQNPAARSQAKGIASANSQQQRRDERDERDFNCTKALAAGVVPQELANRSLQSLQAMRRTQAKPDWPRPQTPASVDKRRPNASSNPSVSYSVANPLQATVSPTKSEARFSMTGNEVKTSSLQAGTLTEPVIMMQRPQTINGKPNLQSATITVNGTTPASQGWYPNEFLSMEMKVAANSGIGAHKLPKLLMNGSRAQPYYPQSSLQPFTPTPIESSGTGRGTSSSPSSSSSLGIPSSLGLFTGWNSSGPSGSPSSAVDWSTGGSVSHFDYTSIDWSLDPIQLKLERDAWSSSTTPSSYVGVKASRSAVNGGGLLIDPSHEWTSPFAGKDLFRVPRQFVTSASL